MNQENGLNHYQRFAGTSLEINRLGRLPIGRSQLLGFPVGDDRVNVVKSPVHAVNLEFDAQFSHAVPLQGFVLLVVKIDGGEGGALIGARDGEGVARIAQRWTEVPIVRVVHPYRKVQ